MKKKGYFEYDPVIYPHKLWVCIGDNDGIISKIFGKVSCVHDEGVGGTTFSNVKVGNDDHYGTLVAFPSHDCIDVRSIAHEASHVVDAFEKRLGLIHGGEHSAYLAGWIAFCLRCASIGEGKFIEIESYENNQ